MPSQHQNPLAPRPAHAAPPRRQRPARFRDWAAL